MPTQYGHHPVWVKGYVHRVMIVWSGEVVAGHERTYERETGARTVLAGW